MRINAIASCPYTQKTTARQARWSHILHDSHHKYTESDQRIQLRIDTLHHEGMGINRLARPLLNLYTLIAAAS